MKVLKSTTENINGNSTSELYKELEKSNFEALSSNRKQDDTKSLERAKIQNWVNQNKLSPVLKTQANTDQFAVFQRSMRVLNTCGQLIGINPFIGICEKDVSKIRFTFTSWRFGYSTVIGVIQAIAAALCVYRMFRQPISIGTLAFATFHFSTCLSTFMFMRIALKWPALMKELYESALDEYVDHKIHIKCIFVTFVLLTLALLEYILSLIAKVAQLMGCNTDYSENMFKLYMIKYFSWFYELDVPYSLPMGIVLQFNNITATVSWNFSDLFIVCISLYLTSILEQINKKIHSACNERLLPSIFWRSLREDYTRATSLVRSFDHVLNGIIFVSFASNLFFICLQLFNVLANGILSRSDKSVCPLHSNSPFTGYEYTVYFLFSLALLFARSLAVSIIAASVHTATLVPAPALYNVPASAYCDEVQRFLDQVHGDKVALSGLNFFHVTRELVLSVAGTIVTYELVLLQFDSDELNK